MANELGMQLHGSRFIEDSANVAISEGPGAIGGRGHVLHVHRA
jgi:hypothetical protein